MKNMLSEALREIRGLQNQLLTNLEGEQGDEWLKMFKKFLRKEPCWTTGISFSVTYDQSLGLTALIKRAVGEANVNNINSDITQERFPLQGKDVRTVNLRVEPRLDGETNEKAAKRLTAAGHILADTGDLAGFLHDHPEEVEKWSWVVALAKSARWTFPNGCVSVPYANVDGAYRGFSLDGFCDRFRSTFGVLVRSE
jgi:hypothetical protein